jgi:hypothetical protein
MLPGEILVMDQTIMHMIWGHCGGNVGTCQIVFSPCGFCNNPFHLDEEGEGHRGFSIALDREKTDQWQIAE